MEILKYPDPRLTARNMSVGTWTPEVAAKVEEMFKAMNKVDGVGLAAPQVGWNVKLFIMGIPNKESGETETTVVFNPTIELFGDEKVLMEGCLSFPFIAGTIRRRSHARLIGMTPNGPIDRVVEGLSAHAVQHEMDHLNGILFIERMTPADRKLNAHLLKELEDKWERRA